MEEENPEFFTITYKLKGHHDSIETRIESEEYFTLRDKLLAQMPLCEFVEIVISNPRRILDFMNKSLIVHRSEIISISFDAQWERKNVIR